MALPTFNSLFIFVLVHFQLEQLQGSMKGDLQRASAKADEMESSLVSSKHELLRVQEMLEMANTELEKKVYCSQGFGHEKILFLLV